MTTATEDKKADQLYSDAFDEAAAKHAEDSGEPINLGDDSEKVATEGGAHQQVDNADSQAGKVVETTGDDNQGEEKDYKALYEKETQRNKSWEGRISKAERDAREAAEQAERLREENALLKNGKTAKKPDGTDSATAGRDGDGDPKTELSDEEKAAQEEVAREYTTIDKAIDAKVRLALRKAAPAEVDERVRRIEQRIVADEKSSHESHYRTLEQAHPNFDEEYVKSGALLEWIESLPYREAVKARQVYESGDTRSSLELLDKFATATGRKTQGAPTTTNNTQSPSRKQLESMTAVRRHSGKPEAGGGVPDKDDYDAAFDRAASRYEKR